MSVGMDEYVDRLAADKLSRQRTKQDNESLTPPNHRTVRGMNGQVQQVVRLLLHSRIFEASRLAGQMSCRHCLVSGFLR